MFTKAFRRSAGLFVIVVETQARGRICQADGSVDLSMSSASAMLSFKSAKAFGLYHPELGGVAGGVGIFGAEGGAEGVYAAKACAKVSPSSWRTRSGWRLFRKVGAKIHTAVLLGGFDMSSVVTRNISPAPSQSLPVIMGGVDIDKTALVEKFVYGKPPRFLRGKAR